MNLEDTIRAKITTQLKRQNKKNSLLDAVDRSIWIAGNYGIQFRIGGYSRSPIKRLENSLIKIPINKVNRIMTLETFLSMYPNRHSVITDIELVNKIRERLEITKEDLAKHYALSIKQINQRIRKELVNWNIFILNDKIFDATTYIQQEEIHHTLQDLLLKIIKNYPLITLEQLEYLTGLGRNKMVIPINVLVKKGLIKRGIIRDDSPDELFAPIYFQLSQDSEFQTFILEKRDALVEIIKLERYFVSKNGNFWIFIDGLPQAEFNFKKIKNSKKYTVINLNKFSTTNYDLIQILEHLKNWAIKSKVQIVIDSKDEPLIKYSIKMVSSLLSRGFRLDKDVISLRKKGQIQSTSPQNNVNNFITWKIIGQWVKSKQFMNYSGTTYEIGYELGQIEDIRSLSYRTNTKPSNLDLTDFIYTNGIDGRLAFIVKDLIDEILKGWPKTKELNFLDKKILGALHEPKTTNQILNEVGNDHISIKQRIRYLEKKRAIRRYLPGSISFYKCVWVLFNFELDDLDLSTISRQDIRSVEVFFIKLLQSHPPLTITQISRYLGLTKNQLKPFLRHQIKQNQIVEGYFIEGEGNLQYTLRNILDNLSQLEYEENDISAVQRADLLPFTDPYAYLHLPSLVVNNPSIQPTKRFPKDTEQWAVFWDGIPIGYVLVYPSEIQLLDYELELMIVEEMLSGSTILGSLQKMVEIMRVWYSDEGKLNSINGIEINHKRWEYLKFQINSIGLTLENR